GRRGVGGGAGRRLVGVPQVRWQVGRSHLGAHLLAPLLARSSRRRSLAAGSQLSCPPPRSPRSSGRRTSVGFVPSGGRPCSLAAGSPPHSLTGRVCRTGPV